MIRILDAALLFFTPGALAWLVFQAVIAWPYGPHPFPEFAPAAVPWEMAKLVTGYWLLCVGVALIGVGCWYGRR